MNTIKINSIQNFAVISDCHLSLPQDALTALFIKTLSSLKNIDAVFLLGDIFDFIGVSSHFFLNLWLPVFAACADLKKRGVQVYFLEGNHDFGFEHFKRPFLDNCFTWYGDACLEFLHPKLGVVHVRHGDDVICDRHYHIFRKLVKSFWFQKINSLLCPGFLMQFIFSRYAKYSRKKDSYRTLPENFLFHCLNNYLENHSAIDTLIIGHIHMLNDRTINNKVRFLSGPAWLTHPSVLTYQSVNGFDRFVAE